jgi:hypothetical protein
MARDKLSLIFLIFIARLLGLRVFGGDVGNRVEQEIFGFDIT